MENVAAYRKALTGLKKNQIVDLLKDVREALQINTTGKNKTELVNVLLAIHGTSGKPNLFGGKPLLSFNKDSHIKIPQRAAKVDRKAEKAEKEAAKKESERVRLQKALAENAKKSKEKAQREQAQKAARIAKKQNMMMQEAVKKFRERARGASPAKIDELRKEFAEVRKRILAIKD